MALLIRQFISAKLATTEWWILLLSLSVVVVAPCTGEFVLILFAYDELRWM